MKELELLELANAKNQDDKTARDRIVERLLQSNLITFDEAVLLLKSTVINISAEKLEMSSGAKIVGGSDFETTKFT